MNKKVLSIAASSALALSATAASATTYSVYGNWTDLNTIGLANGNPVDLLTGVDFTISGTVTTDIDSAGYQILSGSLQATGYMTVNYDPGTGPLPLFITYNMSGFANNSGAVFNSGSVCFGYLVGDCSAGTAVLDGNPNNYGIFNGTGTFAAGYATTVGLELLDGTGGSSFTVAQPGDFYYNDQYDTNLWTGGTGTVSFFGSPGGIFLGGDLTFTEVPVPAAAWLFGSALLSFISIGRWRGRQ